VNDDPGALPVDPSLSRGPGGAGAGERPDWAGPRRNILFIAWRDLANRLAGGSEVLVDQLASGLAARGHRVTLLAGGTVAERPYPVHRNGGTYSQFLRAPLAYLRNFRDVDLIVEVCNGMPFLVPLWSKKPVICLVNHVHTELWPIRFRPPVCTVGRRIENTVMPWVHRENLFLTVSPSTAEALNQMGVGPDRIRQICNGVMQPDPLTPRSARPLFLALGRLTEYKRIDMLLRLWERVRQVTGGTLVISGVEPPKRFEWTPLYFKELHVIGSNGFGIEEVGGVAKHSMEHYFDFVAGGLDLTPVITHRFPLDRWDEAVLTLKDSRRTGAVKVLLEPAR